MAKSPSVSLSAGANVANGSGLALAGSFSRSRARSVSLSVPTTVAVMAWLSSNRQRTSVALSTTCQLVTTSPAAEISTPLPHTSPEIFLPDSKSSRMHLMNTTAGNTLSLAARTTAR